LWNSKTTSEAPILKALKNLHIGQNDSPNLTKDNGWIAAALTRRKLT
jgi:hypothetical protein